MSASNHNVLSSTILADDSLIWFFSFYAPAPTEIYTLSLHDALPICLLTSTRHRHNTKNAPSSPSQKRRRERSEEHTSELQSRGHLVCRLLLEKKKLRIRRRHPRIHQLTISPGTPYARALQSWQHNVR